MNSYALSRSWFDFCFENPEKISPNHTAIFFFAIEHCNRMGWKEKFSFPTGMAKEAVGIKSYNTYIKCFYDLVEWGFIILIQKSENQYSSNIIALSKFDKPLDKSLDKAMINHLTNQSEITEQTNDSINKHLNIKTKEHYNQEGEIFSEPEVLPPEEEKPKYEYAPPRSQQKVVAPNFEEVHYYFHQNNSTREAAQHFYNRYDACGWEVSGSPIKNWRSLAQSWIIRAAKYDTPQQAQPTQRLQRNKTAVELAKEQIKNIFNDGNS